MAGANCQAARAVFRSVKDIFSATARFIEVEKAPQQRNGYDCGVYVLAMAEVLCAAAASGQALAEKELKEFSDLTPQYIAALRTRLLELINTKALQ